MKASYFSPYVFLFFFSVVSCSKERSEEITLNHIQVIGSHNSYKQRIEPSLMSILLAKDSSVLGLDYEHVSIREQLELGLRGLEIDVVHDPVGGRYSHPLGLSLLAEKGAVPLPYDTSNQLSKGGLKVLHVPDVDFRSHCLSFKNCLQEVKNWSRSNPGHVPVIITINPKGSGGDKPGFTKVLPFTAAVLDSLDQEILEVFSLHELISPDMVQGEFLSLREAVTTQGWPALESCKGKILFVLDADADVTRLYLQTSLKGKPMFPNVDEQHACAGFFILNDPKKQLQEIQQRVKQGFMVRTRADADTREARALDYSRLEAAIASGAQLISTDYYLGKLSPSGEFQVNLKDEKYQSCNPIVAPTTCSL
jgi:hypothetical protein